MRAPWQSSSDVDQILRTIEWARNGGDYDTIFNGMKLGFKIEKVKEAAEELNESAGEAKESVEEALELLLPGGGGDHSQPSGFQLIVDKIKEIVALFKQGAAFVLDKLKTAFKGLLEVFDHLRESLMTALEPILTAARLTLEAVVDLLFQLIPTAITEFIGNLMAAIIPLVNQIKPLGDMLKSVGSLVAAQYRLHMVSKAAAAIDPSLTFASAARDSVLRTLTEMRNSKGVGVLMSGVDLAGAATGAFTGGVSTTVVSAATSVTKLCLCVSDLVGDCNQVKKGNELLNTLSVGGRSAAKDLDPIVLFNAAPILACCYIGRATQSSLISKAGFTGQRGVFTTDGAWMAEYKRYADMLWPLRQAAMQAELASRLDLFDNGKAVEFQRLQKSRLTLFIDQAEKRRRELEEEARRLEQERLKREAEAKRREEERQKAERERTLRLDALRSASMAEDAQKTKAAADEAARKRLLVLKDLVSKALIDYKTQTSGARGLFTIQSTESRLVILELEARRDATTLADLDTIKQWVEFGLGKSRAVPQRKTSGGGSPGALKLGGRLHGLLSDAYGQWSTS